MNEIILELFSEIFGGCSWRFVILTKRAQKGYRKLSLKVLKLCNEPLIFENHLYIRFLMDYLFAKPLSSTNFLPHFGKNIANALNLC